MEYVRSLDFSFVLGLVLNFFELIDITLEKNRPD